MSKNRALVVAGIASSVLAALVFWRSMEHDSANTSGILPSSHDEPSTARTAAESPAHSTDIEQTTRDGTTARAPAVTALDPLSADVANTTTLVVRAVDKRSNATLSNVHILLGPKPGDGSTLTLAMALTHGPSSAAALTDEHGEARFAVTPDIELVLFALPLRAETAGEHVEVPPLHAGETRELVVKLDSNNDQVFWCKVVSRDDGSPIGACTYRVVHQSMSQSFVRGASGLPDGVVDKEESALDSGTTDASGRFRIFTDYWLLCSALVEAKGFSALFVPVRKGHESEDTAHVVRLARAATLRARVTQSGGSACAGAIVRLSTESSWMIESDPDEEVSSSVMGDSTWTATTASDGSCALANLPANVPLRIAIDRIGFLTHEEVEVLTLAPGEERKVEWSLDARTALVGRVVDQRGAPVASHEIWLEPARAPEPAYFTSFGDPQQRSTATTNSDGEFRFDDVASGSWWIGPAVDRDMNEPPAQDAIAALASVVEVGAGAREQRVDLRVQRGLYIRGRVVDPNDKPVANAIVNANGDDGPLMPTRTQTDGSFAIGPLAPGAYKVNAWFSSQFAARPTVDARAGDRDVLVKLVLGGTLSGVVVDASTGEPCKAQVVLSQHERSLSRAWTTDAGVFRWEGLEAGAYDVAASAGRNLVGVLRDAAVSAGSETSAQRIDLRPGARIDVRYDGSGAGGEIVVASGGITVAVDAVRKGAGTACRIPAGHVIVRFTPFSKHTSADRELDVAVGDEREIVFGDE